MERELRIKISEDELIDKELIGTVNNVPARKTLWFKYYEAVKGYLEGNNYTISRDSKAFANGQIFKINDWLITQGIAKLSGILSADEVSALDEIKVSYDVDLSSKTKWDKSYEVAVEYFNKHKHLAVPRDYQALDCDGNIVCLENWLIYNRQSFAIGSITDEHYRMLNDIGMLWTGTDRTWYKCYLAAKDYYDKAKIKVLILKDSCMVNDMDNLSFDLKLWIDKQKQLYNAGMLPDEKRDLLQEIGVQFNYADEKWYFQYLRAWLFIKKYGTFEFARAKRAVLSPEDLEVYDWFLKQRRLYMTKELDLVKIQLLTNMGFILNLRENREGLRSVCIRYGIPEAKNANILKYYSYQELQARINYLGGRPYNDSGYNPSLYLNADGTLKDIFGLSVNLESLINDLDIPKEGMANKTRK